MPSTPLKANYRTFESQARLVRAMVAAHPEVKWNYKEVAECFGSDITEHAVQHRFRVIRAHAEIVRLGRAAGQDPAFLPAEPMDNPRTIDKVDKRDIAKYFGASTPDGMQFHFRGIKKDAMAITKAVDAGDDPHKIPLSTGAGDPSSSVTSTPRSAARTAGRKTPSSRAQQKTPLSIKTPNNNNNNYNDASADASDDDDDLVVIDTPTKPRGRVIGGRITKPTPHTAARKADNRSQIGQSMDSLFMLDDEQSSFDDAIARASGIVPKPEAAIDDDDHDDDHDRNRNNYIGATSFPSQPNSASGAAASSFLRNDYYCRAATQRSASDLSLDQDAAIMSPNLGPAYATPSQHTQSSKTDARSRTLQQQEFMQACYDGAETGPQIDYIDGEF